jgi:hypothetical protein
LLDFVQTNNLNEVKFSVSTLIKVQNDPEDIGFYNENPLETALQCYAKEEVNIIRQSIILSLLESKTCSLEEKIYPHRFVPCDHPVVTVLEHFLTTSAPSAKHIPFLEGICRHYAPKLVATLIRVFEKLSKAHTEAEPSAFSPSPSPN